MDILNISTNLTKAENDILYSKDKSNISYPDEGNDLCYQIEDNSFWFMHRNDAIITAVKKFSSNETLFDIGGGNGFVSLGLEKSGIDVILVEPGLKGAKNAKKRGVSNVICATLENAGFKESIIPSIGLFDVIEHIDDDRDFLLKINALHKINGYLYITVPSYNWLWSNEDVDAGHYRRYTLKSISQLLNSVGYQIEYSTYIFTFLIIPILFLRSIPSRIGLNKKSNDPNKHANEHQSNKGFVGQLVSSILNFLLKFELFRIKKNKTIPFGSSCFLVAKKKQNKST